MIAKLAINGGRAVRKKPFLLGPVFGEEEISAVTKVLRSGKWWYGEKVKEFEERYAAFQQARYGVTATNGTAALEIALISAGIGAGDEVIIPSYSFIATATAVLQANAIPIFCDIEEETFNIDTEKIAALVNDKTKAIIPVHFAGLPCDMDRINKIAARHSLKVIEDACHSWGSQWKDKGTGALGDAGVFSFQMSKNITAGEGGIILTDNAELADRCRSYSNCGRVKDKPWYEHHIIAGNYRMTEIQAAILLVQIKRLEEQTVQRERNADYLTERLASIPFIQLVKRDARVTRRAYHMFIFRYLPQQLKHVARAKFIAALNAEGIPASPGYPHPLYKNPLFTSSDKGPGRCPFSCPYYGKEIDYSAIHLPVVERLTYEEAVWLGHSMLLGRKEDMDDIVKAIEKIQNNANELL